MRHFLYVYALLILSSLISCTNTTLIEYPKCKTPVIRTDMGRVYIDSDAGTLVAYEIGDNQVNPDDMSDPDSSSDIYTGSFDYNSNSVFIIKAVAFRDGWQNSEVAVFVHNK